MKNEVYEAALRYAALGWHVVPLHHPLDASGCSCGKSGCKSIGKHPRTKHGLKDASVSPVQIKNWFVHQWPEANLAIVTGAISKLAVMDLDGEDGEESLWGLEQHHGKLPTGPENLTGGGGRHLLCAHPGAGVKIGNRQKLAPGLDVRGDGGYIVAPPSRHASGRCYEWEASSDPQTSVPPPLPPWLLTLLTASTQSPRCKQADGVEMKSSPAVPGPVIQGCGWLADRILHAAIEGEQSWYAKLTLAARMEDGARLAHEWSRAHPDYNREATTAKLEHAAGSPGPVTCAFVRDRCGGEPFCAKCEHWSKIRSPLSLARTRESFLPVPPPGRLNLGLLEEPLPDPEPIRPFRLAGARPATNGHLPEAPPVDEVAVIAAADDEAGAEMTLDEARVAAKTALRHVKDDAGLVYDPKALRALALLRRWDPQTWAQLKQKLMKARVGLGELIKQFPLVTLAAADRAALNGAAHAEPAAAGNGAAPQYAGEMLEDCPLPSLIVPQSYRLREYGVERIGQDDEGAPVAHTIAFAPVVINGRMRDAVTGVESVLLAWRWPGAGWQSRVTERGQALTGKRLAELANLGFPVADDSVKHLVGYLHRLEAINRRSLPCAAVSSHLGWQGEGEGAQFLVGRTLIQPDGEIVPATALDLEKPEEWTDRRIAFHGIGEGEEQLVDAFHARGSMATWLEAVETVRPYPKVLLGFYASFTPPLLALFGVPNFIIDWHNRTSTGKTTCLRVAASVWGNPDERAPDSIIGTWDATRVWSERAAAVLSGLPLLMDDTKKAKNPRVVADLIYAVASGRGRGRGNIRGLSSTPTWRTVLFSTGEGSATSFTQDGGTRTRTLEIRGLPFGAADLETGRVVGRLNATLTQHYGHAGPLFLRWVMREHAELDRWRKYYQDLVEDYATEPPSAEAGRLAQYAALITVAGVMAHRALELPWEFGDPLKTLWIDLATEAAEASGAYRALEYVYSWAGSQEHTFICRRPGGEGFRADRSSAVISGRWPDEDAWEYLAIYPNILREVLKRENYDYDAVVSEWKERGWLKAPAKPDKTVTYPVDIYKGRQARMVVVKREAIDGLE